MRKFVLFSLLVIFLLVKIVSAKDCGGAINSKWYSYGSKKFLNILGKLKPGYGYWVKKH